MTSTPGAPGADPVAVSAEQVAPVGGGIQLCYQTFGDPAGDPLLLVMGLGGPMLWWDEGLCQLLAAAGFYVVRYDNRDTGRSTILTGDVGVSHLAGAFAGLRVRAPYAMSDLADDAAGLLDHLGIERAHLFGVSMGGMIVQTLAIAHPDRVASLVSTMSTTGRRSVGYQHPSIYPQMLRRPPAGEQEYVERSLVGARLTGSPGYPEPEDSVRRRAVATWARGIHPDGTARQMLAVLTQPDRTADLGRLDVPAAVVHGLADKMVHVSGGRATAVAIPRAELMLIDGMGHDLPVPLWERFVRVVRRTADRAR
ncbi:MAG: alpha/beta hydrolase [Nocardioides sp.]|uniref:alpha/beta fold hydrolase n=1 Tax=Nocardioides sp. TaxID=35761 RepID=UPI0039E3823B